MIGRDRTDSRSASCVAEGTARRQIGSATAIDAGKVAGVFAAIDACRSFADFLRSG